MAGAIRTPTPMNPPARPSRTGNFGQGVARVIQERKPLYIGTVETLTAARPVSIYFSEKVTPPLPPNRTNPPTMSEERHVTRAGDFAPRARAIPYIKKPAVR